MSVKSKSEESRLASPLVYQHLHEEGSATLIRMHSSVHGTIHVCTLVLNPREGDQA